MEGSSCEILDLLIELLFDRFIHTCSFQENFENFDFEKIFDCFGNLN